MSDSVSNYQKKFNGKVNLYKPIDPNINYFKI
jgi:hypothetical protein